MEKSSRNTYKVFAPIISYNSIKVDEQIELNEITRMTFIPLERTRLVIGEQPEGEINEKLQKLPRRDYHILNWIWYTRPSLNLRWDGQGRFMNKFQSAELTRDAFFDRGQKLWSLHAGWHCTAMDKLIKSVDSNRGASDWRSHSLVQFFDSTFKWSWFVFDL